MNTRRAFTLIEVLLALALISLIIAIGTNLLIFGTKSYSKAMDESSIQTNVRLITQNLNNYIRDSSAVFLLNKEYPSDTEILEDYFTEGWNYLMLNKDATKFIEWVWDGDKHIIKDVISPLENVKYEIEYDKKSLSNQDRLLKYSLKIKADSKVRTINSELEGINTLQVIDRSYGKVANTLAFRNDPRLTDIGVAQAAVSFVIDKSGSMTTKLSGSKTRIDVLKEEATKMIEGLSEYENAYLSISPFSATANSEISEYTNTMLPIKPNIDKFINASKSVIKTIVAKGGTNTGDGMRRGLSTIVEFNTKSSNADKTTKNFMIILVDGDTTFASVTERINNEISESGSSSSHKSNIILNQGTENQRQYNWVKTVSSGWWIKTYTHTYKYNGPDSITYYTPLDKNVDDYAGTDSTSGNPFYGLVENNYKSKGKVIGNGSSLDVRGSEYVRIIGEMIKGYKNTRDDGIDVFIIGFAGDSSSTGLQQIANATQSKFGTHGTNFKYYKADTAEALETVLNEIKFQISEALWHIGGPN